jgi:hypothetical protein
MQNPARGVERKKSTVTGSGEKKSTVTGRGEKKKSTVTVTCEGSASVL